MSTVRQCAMVVFITTLLGYFSTGATCEELPFPPPRPSLRALEQIQGVLKIPAKAASPQGMPAVNEEGELITERYPNRAVRLQRYVIQDADRNYVNHGSWTLLDPQGQVIGQGEYRNGKRHGPWMRIVADFPTAISGFQSPFTSQAEFDNGQLHGTWTIIDSQQRVVGTWQFSQGELDGAATTWYPNGAQRREMNFAKGIPDGESTAWRADGKVWAREFYRGGKQLIPIVTYHDQKQKETEGWMVRTNFTISANVDWWETKIEVTRQDTEGEDVRTGKWTEWYANGTKKFEGDFEAGMPVAQHTWWHPNGQKMIAGTYEKGMQEGRWTEWHATGMKQTEGTYLAGLKSGTWTTWSTEGLVADTQQFETDLNTGRPTEPGIVIAEDGDESHNVSHILAP